MTNFNPYYLAISGTSMATPHISGICALLWQAYPGMRTSKVHDDYNGKDFPDWFNLSNTLVHEAELILDASAHYIEPNADNGVPEDATILGKNVIGHGSATSAILRVDLDNELVICQSRCRGGKAYGKYLAKFLAAIEAGLE